MQCDGNLWNPLADVPKDFQTPGGSLGSLVREGCASKGTLPKQLAGVDVPARGHCGIAQKGFTNTSNPPGPTCAQVWLCLNSHIQPGSSAGVGKGFEDPVVPHFWGLEPCHL